MCLGALGVIDEVWSEGGVPMASVDGEPVCLMYTPGASMGDPVLVHLGFSVEIIEEQRAAAALALRSELALEVREETV
jgi:hydrogenase expression/formation protein HypC